ncbi:MAG TPA: glycosyltransferase [Caulobacteraceae bacterium]|nr:glycosyltransferase [Caulobacteraceae bacterium]
MAERFWFLTPEFGDLGDPIFRTQVLALAEALKTERPGLDVAIWGCWPEAGVSDAGVPLRTLPRGGRQFLQEAKAAATFLKQVPADGRTVVYTRSYMPAFVLTARPRPGVVGVFNVRGLAAEELRMKGGGRIKAALVRAMEARAVRASDVTVSIADAMTRRLRESYGLKDAEVIRPTVDVERFAAGDAERAALRAAWGWGEDDFAFLYVGGRSAWQMEGRLEALVGELLAREPRARFLRVVRDGGGFSDEGEQDRVRTIRNAPHGRIPAFAAAADFGLVLREADAVNQVASPIKAIEYLAAGLPVITTEGVGDLSDLVRARDAGVVLAAPDALGEVDWASHMDRNAWAQASARARSLAGDEFSLEAAARRWGALADRL